MKKLLIRCVLVILILLNLWLISSFSGEDAKKSDQTSHRVTEAVAGVVIKDFETKPSEEKNNIVAEMHPSVRTMAHMAEFGCLGGLVMLLCLTYTKKALLAEGISLAFVLITAIADELRQHFDKAGRAAQVKDVLFDLLGAVIVCTLLLLLILLLRYLRKRSLRKPLAVSRYTIFCEKLSKPLRIALASDLHDNPWGRVIDALDQEKPDLILIPGDLTDDDHIREGAAETLAFLHRCSNIAPTYYSIGNHEIKCYHRGNPFRHPIPVPVPNAYREAVASCGVTFLDDSIAHRDDLSICGITSGINGKENHPSEAILEAIKEDTGRVKILLCHHPEYYMPYLRALSPDLVVSGHAHGGHWRFFGRGVYSPGQGLFPRYTSGLLDGRCVISRGLGDHTHIPRIANPVELVMVTLTPAEATK